MTRLEPLILLSVLGIALGAVAAAADWSIGVFYASTALAIAAAVLAAARWDERHHSR